MSRIRDEYLKQTDAPLTGQEFYDRFVEAAEIPYALIKLTPSQHKLYLEAAKVAAGLTDVTTTASDSPDTTTEVDKNV